MMKHAAKDELYNVVPHPRYGVAPRPSGIDVNSDDLRGFWFIGHKVIGVFPETAIPADTTKQKITAVGRDYYIDVLKCCRDCDRRFIFFAEEQRHWYEELGFYVEADCVRCPECRKADQTLRRRFDRFSRLIVRNDLSDDDLALVVDDAVFLWCNAILTDHQKLRRIRNIAKARIPDHQVVCVIDQLVASLPPEGSA